MRMQFRKLAFAASIFSALVLVGSGPARAITYDVSGTNFLGDTLTGTVEADASLTTITSVNLVNTDSFFGGQFTVFRFFDVFPGEFTVSTAGLTKSANFFFLPESAAVLQNYEAALADARAQFNVASCDSTDIVCQIVVNQELAGALSTAATQYGDPFALTATAEVSATPLPAALPLYATGLGALALLRWRRKRKGLVAA